MAGGPSIESQESLQAFIRKSQEDGSFSRLTQREQSILKQHYLQSDKEISFKEIGEVFQPRISATAVRQHEHKALWYSGYGRSIKPVETLGLPRKVLNAVLRSSFRDLSLNDLSQLPDDELLLLSGFGSKSLHTFRKKLFLETSGQN